MKNYFITVVVPIYNAEQYIERAVKSLLNQTTNEIEIILVDDGSKDNSIEICKNYLNQDKRVQLIHQENSGVSAARNRGIEQACGEYIGFIDSDDWIEPNMYECLLREANQASADIVICDARTVYEDGKIQADTGKRRTGSDDGCPDYLHESAGQHASGR